MAESNALSASHLAPHKSGLTITLVCLCFLCAPLDVVLAEQTAVVLRSQDLQAYNLAIEGFMDECKENNITVRAVEDLGGNMERGRKIIKKYSGDVDKPDLFLAVGVLAATLAKKDVKDTPIIFCMVVNYRRFRLEGPNVSGIASEMPEKDCMKIYKELIEGIENVGVIYDPLKTGGTIAEGKRASKELGLRLIDVKVRSEREVEGAIRGIINRIDALWLIPDSTVISRDTFALIHEIATKEMIPILCTSDTFVRAGALIGVFPDYADIGREAGRIAQEILKEGDNGSIGVRYPERLRIAINSRAAQMIKLDIQDLKDRYSVIEYP